MDRITSTVAAARMVGLISWRMPAHIWRGRVSCSAPPRKRMMTTSSNEVMKAKSAPEMTPGAIRGSWTLKKLYTGVPPSPCAARVNE